MWLYTNPNVSTQGLDELQAGKPGFSRGTIEWPSTRDTQVVFAGCSLVESPGCVVVDTWLSQD